jgi:hypothetical protein
MQFLIPIQRVADFGERQKRVYFHHHVNTRSLASLTPPIKNDEQLLEALTINQEDKWTHERLRSLRRRFHHESY